MKSHGETKEIRLEDFYRNKDGDIEFTAQDVLDTAGRICGCHASCAVLIFSEDGTETLVVEDSNITVLWDRSERIFCAEVELTRTERLLLKSVLKE